MKIYSYLVILAFACLSLIPPINVVLRNPANPYWLWIVMIAGFLGVFTLFIKTSNLIRCVAIIGFINCFFSTIPYVSFTSYISLVACCYFYILCCQVKDWDLIFQAVQSIIILNIIIMCFQLFRNDRLFNFGYPGLNQFGTIGYHMWMASFGIILAALAIQYRKLNFVFPIVISLFCNSTWTFLSASVGICVYFVKQSPKISGIVFLVLLIIFAGWAIRDRKILSNLDHDSGRIAIWERSIKLSNVHPIKGWGIGTYKELFFPLSGLNCLPWKTAHNFIIQMIFEIGYPLTGCLLLCLAWLVYVLFYHSQWLLLSGLVMMILDGLVHFPDRMIQTVPLIIMFLAYVRFILRRYT